MRALLIAIPLLLVVSAPSPALASQTFPDHIKAKLPTMPCVPQCTLCHQQNPGLPPANRPFALKLKMASAVLPQQTAQLDEALNKLQMAGATSDADGDGKGDFDELLAGEDPNSATVGATLCDTVPLYGCGARVAAVPAKRAANPTAAVGAVLTALVGMLLLRRRRR